MERRERIKMGKNPIVTNLHMLFRFFHTRYIPTTTVAFWLLYALCNWPIFFILIIHQQSLINKGKMWLKLSQKSPVNRLIVFIFFGRFIQSLIRRCFEIDIFLTLNRVVSWISIPFDLSSRGHRKWRRYISNAWKGTRAENLLAAE